jgi:hypothetical protein
VSLIRSHTDLATIEETVTGRQMSEANLGPSEANLGLSEANLGLLSREIPLIGCGDVKRSPTL